VLIDRDKPEPFGLRDRTASHDGDNVANLGFVLLVVRVVLLGIADPLRIKGIVPFGRNGDRDGFVHLDRRDNTLRRSFCYFYPW
jgi:hypothetical protein